MYQAMNKARARASLPVNTRPSAPRAASQHNPEVGLRLYTCLVAFLLMWFCVQHHHAASQPSAVIADLVSLVIGS